MRSVILTLLFTLVFPVAQSFAQKGFHNELNGFQLRQYRSAPEGEFGRPDQSGPSGDEIEYEAFFLNEEPLAYMVFQYRSELDGVIWSIQLTGLDGRIDAGFKGLRLGIPEAEVLKVLGKPTRKIDVEQHGTRWEYEGTNYSV